MGTISFAGQNVDGVPVHQRARRGLVRAYQVPQLFPSFSAHGNVAVSAIARAQTHRRWWRPGGGGGLGGGEGRERALARGSAAGRSLLLLEEPLAGLGPGESQRMIEF